MAMTLHELIQPQIIMGMVSRVRKGQGRLSKWFGFQPLKFDKDRGVLAGSNVKEGYGRAGTFRIFNNTRVPAIGRAPGTGPAVAPRNPIGQVHFTYARAHEKIPLLYEDLGNMSQITGPNSVIDQNGQTYVAAQEKVIAQKFNVFVECLTAGMIRGTLYLQQIGDNWIPSFTQPTTGAYETINYQIPSGNTGQLDMLGNGAIIQIPWSNPAAPIIRDLTMIRAAFEQVNGSILSDIWISGVTWYWIITNIEARNIAGSATSPFAEFENVAETDADGKPTGEQYAVLKAFPMVKFHISNEVVALGGNLLDPINATGTAVRTQIIPDGTALFMPEVDSEWVQLGYGSEPVVENPGQPAVQRIGYYFWHEYTTQPSAVELIGLFNGIPMLYVPANLAFATVDF